MTRKKWALAGIVVAVLLIGVFKSMHITGFDRTTLSPVERVVREVVAPVQSGVTAVTKSISNFFAYFSDNKTLREQNEELSKKIAAQEAEIHRLKEQEMENERLKKLLNYKEEKTNNYQLELAKVIGRDPGNWYETIVINKGANHGIKPNMAVVTHQGLVGRIVNVTANTAEVLLILDREGAVGGRIFETRITPGVVQGLDNSEYLQMIHLPHDTPIEPGQTVVTSGLGGVFPKGIRIGAVVEVKPDANGLMKSAVIEPFVDFSRLEEVFVILNVKKPETDTVPQVLDREGKGGL
ncbi:MAG: rod shape-determining protein MreC [Peptococcaceae bacterium]|nr:rod shape-determining protein MreC [Peptococcaceae bacterium]